MRAISFPVQASPTPMDSPCRIHLKPSTWFCMTAISSILDPGIRRNICADMLRVLRSPDPASGKPGGMILWYDFWLNPINPQTRGIRPAEIKRLFPNCLYEFHRITLAPPIARKLAPISWGLCLFLESLKIFNIIPFGRWSSSRSLAYRDHTHYLATIRPITAD